MRKTIREYCVGLYKFLRIVQNYTGFTDCAILPSIHSNEGAVIIYNVGSFLPHNTQVFLYACG